MYGLRTVSPIVNGITNRNMCKNILGTGGVMVFFLKSSVLRNKRTLQDVFCCVVFVQILIFFSVWWTPNSCPIH